MYWTVFSARWVLRLTSVSIDEVAVDSAAAPPKKLFLGKWSNGVQFCILLLIYFVTTFLSDDVLTKLLRDKVIQTLSPYAIFRDEYPKVKLANDWSHSWCTYDAFVGVCMTSLPVFRQTFGYPSLHRLMGFDPFGQPEQARRNRRVLTKRVVFIRRKTFTNSGLGQ